MNIESSCLADLIEASKIVGREVPWSTQGAGSNFSFKSNGFLVIKGSGKRLDEIKSMDQLAILDLKNFQSELQKLLVSPADSKEKESIYSKLVSAASKNGVRASMEAGFHAILDSKFVLHFHSLLSVVLSEWVRGDVKNSALISSELAALGLKNTLFLEFISPGFLIAAALESHSESQVIFLKNHGVILGGDSAQTLILAWKKFENIVVDKYLPSFKDLKAIHLEALSFNLASLEPRTPDFALYLEAYQKLLLDFNEQALFQLKKDRNLYEVWAANQILAQSSLEVLPISGSGVVSIQSNELEKYRL